MREYSTEFGCKLNETSGERELKEKKKPLKTISDWVINNFCNFNYFIIIAKSCWIHLISIIQDLTILNHISNNPRHISTPPKKRHFSKSIKKPLASFAYHSDDLFLSSFLLCLFSIFNMQYLLNCSVQKTQSGAW